MVSVPLFPILGSTGSLVFSAEQMLDMDGDPTTGDAGKEIRKVHVKQTMLDVDAGDYKVVVKELRDEAGNAGPGGAGGVVNDWVIRLR